MARSAANLLRLLLADPAEAVPDADLLARFTKSKDAAAFELLVRRHADLVYGVCRRVCRDEHDAEDAFQAAFLVLARKADRVHRNLAGWLHRTAHRAALRATLRRTRIRDRETILTVEPAAPTAADVAELRPVLDAEIDRLPDRLRLAVLHCYVEGRTTEDAARRLNVPRGTILSRLSKARDVLAARLTKRGITAPVTAVSLTTALTTDAATPALVAAATTSVIVPAAGSAAHLLSLEVLRMTAWKTTSAWAAALMLTAGLGTGTGIMMAQGPKTTPNPVANARENPAQATKPLTEATPVRSREQRIRELEAQVEQFTHEQVKLREMIRVTKAKQRSVRTGQIDVNLLVSAINRIDQECLALQDTQDDLRIRLDLATARINSAKTMKFAEDEILNILFRESELRDFTLRLKDNGELLKRVEPDSDAAKKAHAEREELHKKQRAFIDANRERVVKQLTSDALLRATNEARTIEDELRAQQRKEELKKERRAQLREQLLASAEEDDSTERLERDLVRTERIQEELSRKLILLRADLEDDSPKSEMERLRREVAELKAEIRKLAEAKK